MGPTERRRLRWLLASVAGGAWIVLTLLGIVSVTVLQTGWWLDSFDRADTYDRVYTEVLADPDTETFVGDLLGGWPVDASLVAGNLRTILPPTTLRRTLEAGLDSLTSYLEGARDDIDATVALEPLWKSIERVLDANVSTAIRSTPSFGATDAEQFRINFVDFVARIATGQRPDFLPNVPLDDSTIDTVVQTLLSGLDATTRADLEPDVRVALAAGDLNSALSMVGQHYARPILDSSIVRLKERAGGDRLDLSVSLSAMQDEPAVQILDAVRVIWSEFLVPSAIGLAIVAIAASIGSALLARREGRDWVRWSIGCLLWSGAISLAVWAILRQVIGDPFDSIWNNPSVPYGLANVVRDTGDDLVRSADWAAVRIALVPAALGGLLAIGVIVLRVLPVARTHRRTAHRVVTGSTIGAVAMIAVLLVVLLWPRPAKVRGEVCNGRADLCDLRLDEVVLAGSHNSQAAADSDFLGPNQDWTMPDQMQVGVRALLIKSMYWESPTMADDFLSTLAPRTAATLRGLIDAAIPQRPGTWMCHNLCAMGAIPLEQGFRWIKEFIDAHPDEVLVVIIGDSIAPADTFATADAAGLTDSIYTPDEDPNAPWPTLEEMIVDRTNVVVFSEHNDVPGTWYRNFFRYAMETPFTVGSDAGFTCEPNRGGDDKRVFLMNNWVTRAMASRLDAGPTNDPVFVEHRAAECADERGHMVNIVAANFVDIPDVFRAVDGLNNLAVLAHEQSADGGRPSG